MIRGLPKDPGPSAELELVQAAQAGDRAAYAVLVQRHREVVFSVAYALTGQLTLSEDVTQETFLLAWRDLPMLRQPERFRPWLLAVARRASLHTLRDQRGSLKETAPSTSVNDFPSPAPSPLDRVITREEENFLWSALRKVPEAYRTPLVLFYREQKSIDKVAEALDLSYENAQMRLTRGRRMLQEQVADLLESTMYETKLGAGFMAAVTAALLAGTQSALAARAARRGGKPIQFKMALVATAGLAGIAVGPWVARGTGLKAISIESSDGAEASLRHQSSAAGRHEAPRLARVASPAFGETAAPAARIVRSFNLDQRGERFPFALGIPAECPPGIDAVHCVVSEASVSTLSDGRFPWGVGLSDPLGIGHSPGVVVSFDYWLSDDRNAIEIQLSARIDGQENCCWSFRPPEPVHRAWGHVTIPVDRLARTSSLGSRILLRDYEELQGVVISQVGPGYGGFYVANLQFGDTSSAAH